MHFRAWRKSRTHTPAQQTGSPRNKRLNQVIRNGLIRASDVELCSAVTVAPVVSYNYRMVHSGPTHDYRAGMATDRVTDCLVIFTDAAASHEYNAVVSSLRRIVVTFDTVVVHRRLEAVGNPDAVGEINHRPLDSVASNNGVLTGINPESRAAMLLKVAFRISPPRMVASITRPSVASPSNKIPAVRSR